MNNRTNYIYDIETMKNCFMAIFEDYKIDDLHKIFIIHESKNDFFELLKFLDELAKSTDYVIGFNNINFDAQVLQFIMVHRNRLSLLSTEDLITEIYNEAQEVIKSQNFTEGGSFRNIPEYKLKIKQIDLLLLNGLNNPARRCSLKWLQYSMDWLNMQEMPIHHTDLVETQEQIDTIVTYCKNDVKSTKELYKRSIPLLEVRRSIKKKYNLDCFSFSDTKLGSELLLQLYCNKTGFSKWDIKKTKTVREEIRLSEILFPYIKFQSLEFTGFLEMIKKKIITETKDAFKYTLPFKGTKFEYGLGGLHACIRSGIYESDNDYVIIDADVAGMYPSIAIVNEMYPAHLGKEFYEVYKNDLVDVRLAEKAKGKDGDKAIIDGFKQAANSSYGNSNNKFSWLCDSQYTMQTTCNGQLLLTMIVEDLLLSISGCLLLQINTDGFTFKLKRSDLDKYYELCRKWEETTKLQLEYAEYSKMFIKDVNNYVSIYTNGKTKCKGSFEFDNLPLYKNKSFLVVTKAVYNFFVYNTPPEQYLLSNRNIFDWCAGIKATGNWIYADVDNFGCSSIRIKGKVEKNYTYTNLRQLSKIVRYYISTNGKKIIKLNKADGRKSEAEAGEYLQTEFNQYIDKPWSEYNINEEYYLEEIYKQIAAISAKETNQLQMEF